MPRLLPTLFCLVAAVACTNGAKPGEGGGDASTPGANDPLDETPRDAVPERPTDPAPAIQFEGAQVTATLDDDARTLGVAIEVPTGGYELAVDDVAMSAGVATVRLQLTTPGEGEIVTQAFETERVSTELPRRASRVIVRVSSWQRGVEYLVPPEAKVAAVVDR